MWNTTSGLGTYPWFWNPIAGWGIGVVAHFLAVSAGDGYIDTQRNANTSG